MDCKITPVCEPILRDDIFGMGIYEFQADIVYSDGTGYENMKATVIKHCPNAEKIKKNVPFRAKIEKSGNEFSIMEIKSVSEDM